MPAKLVHEALGLARRLRDSDPLRAYLQSRLPLLAGAALVMVLAGIAHAAGMVVLLAGTSSFVALLGLLLAPFVLVGSVLVQAYVFLAWLENLALARALHHRIAPPALPWVPIGALLFLPWLLLALLSWKAALVVLVLQAAVPFAYFHLDRRMPLAAPAKPEAEAEEEPAEAR